MGLDEDAKERAFKLSLHEVGHYVVGEVVGFEMDEIKLKLETTGGGGGGAVVEPYRKADTLDLAKRFVEDRLKVLYAGCIAETLKDDKVDKESCKSCFRIGATQDFAKIRELLYLLRCFDGGGQDFIEAKNAELSKAACEIILSELKVVKALATALAGRVQKMGCEYIFTRADIEAVPEFAERFQDRAKS